MAGLWSESCRTREEHEPASKVLNALRKAFKRTTSLREWLWFPVTTSSGLDI